ncbi:putative bifunctional diguanylate cyclase/phosphodiesterase [Pinirhizobacter soli]|uniref:putative bifunctional diguanylate cyclase/phosphodiesterase n=1 Tax=Pinirhizobacter soli TaxID=2786953 RepID=UPI00202AB7DB|nr:EAL domain-containing protein [Pinirhizobacter soli]
MMTWFDRWVALHRTVVRSTWLRRDVRDGALLLAIAGIAYALAHFFDLPRRIFALALAYRKWEMDDLLFVGMVLSVAGPAYGIRRYKDFSREMKGRLRAEREARMLSGHDHLTGLPNERFFAERLDEGLGAMADGDRAATLVVVIEGFKRVVDLHGHVVGDKVLIDFAGRMAALLREGVILARTGGDAFAIAMPKIDSLDEPAGLAHRIVVAMSQAFSISDTAVNVGVSIGIAIAPNDGVTSTTLIQRAEHALYRAKTEDRSSIRFFESEMDAHIERRILMEGRLRKAVERDSIVPHYQPLVSLDDNRIVGFEALARWNDDMLGDVPPDIFIPLSEEIGLIGILGDQVFRRACADTRDWPGDLFMAFNVSAVQLRDPELAPRILAVLEEYAFSPPRLEIEITESALVDHVDDARFAMEHLRGHGVHIVIDDFGTGYATLAQLLSFPLDKIKIDRRFVTNVVNDHDSLVVVRAIVGLANGFGLTSTAEGIEDAEQLSCLKRNGCAQGQGYWFGQAVPAADIAALLAKSSTRQASRHRAGGLKGGAGNVMEFP